MKGAATSIRSGLPGLKFGIFFKFPSAAGGDGEAVFFHHGAELMAEPVGGEAEFPK